MAIPKDMESKIVWQWKRNLDKGMDPFRQYGQDVHIPGFIEMATELMLITHQRLNGEDIPISIEHAEFRRRKRYTK